MDTQARVAFAKGLCGSDKPEGVGTHYVHFYDKLCHRWKMLLSNERCNRNEWPMAAAVADALRERDERIAALETRLASLEAVVFPTAPTEKEAVVPPPPNRVDGRTREGRALKELQPVGEA